MAYSGNVTQVAGVLTFHDTSTISAPLTSKVLVVQDANGTTLATITMGSLTTATYTITSDQWLNFVMTLVDAAGSHIVDVAYLSVYFYWQSKLNLTKALGCGCYSEKTYCKINQANEFLETAEWYAPLVGYGILANTNIIAANTVINS